MLSFKDINIKVAKKFKDRLIGLMFKKNIKYGILFRNCRSKVSKGIDHCPTGGL